LWEKGVFHDHFVARFTITLSRKTTITLSRKPICVVFFR